MPTITGAPSGASGSWEQPTISSSPTAPDTNYISSSTPAVSSPAILSSSSAQNNLNTVVQPAVNKLITGVANQAVANSTAKATADQQAIVAKQAAEAKATQDATAKSTADQKTAELAQKDAETKAKLAMAGVTTPTADTGLKTDTNTGVKYWESQPGIFTATNGQQYDPTTGEYLSMSDLGGQIVRTPANPTAPTTSYTDIQAQQEANDAEFKANMAQFSNGTFPLTVAEQGQLAAVQAKFEKLKQAQQEYNKNYEAGTEILGIRSGRSRYAGELEIGNMQKAVSAGLSKVADIEAQAASALSDLQSAIEDKNYKRVTELYKLTNDRLAQKEATIKSVNEEAQKLLDSAQKAKQQEFENKINSDKFDWQQKKDMVDNALALEKVKYDKTKDDKDYELKLQDLALKIEAGQRADTTEKYKDWVLAGQPGTYAQFLMSATNKPATADQEKNAGFALRMKEANNNISLLTKQFTDLNLLGQFTATKAPTWLISAENQMLQQSQRDFVNAILRRESGAAISPSEFESATLQYFPQPGDSQAVIEQKARNRQISLQGIVQSSGNALSDEFKQQVETGGTVYSSLDQYKMLKPDKWSEIESIIEKENLNAADALKMINRMDARQSFSQVGGDTKLASEVASVPDKTDGGQCGRFVNKFTKLGVGDSYQSKLDKMDPSITYPTAGMVFVMPTTLTKYKANGHTGIILSVNNGIATVKDSNWDGDEKVKTHQIPVSKMTGFKRIT